MKTPNVKKKAIDLIYIILSNGLTMIAGILIGFVIPKIMPIVDYGYYKIYTLYINYLPLLHFGLSTGIYLKYGDKSYDELNKSHFRYYFRLLLFSQSLFGLILFVFSFFFKNQNYKFIIIILAITLISSNIVNYFQLISQITERYKEFSKKNAIQAVLNITIVIICYLYNVNYNYILTYKIYLYIVLAIQILMAIWYICIYKDIIFGKIDNKPSIRLIVEIYKIGFILIFAGLIAQLILTLDRQFVSLLFSTEDYAIYAFAYSLLSLMTTFINTISTVIYPSIKRMEDSNRENSYYILNRSMLLASGLIISCYFILEWIIKHYLEKYEGSLVYLYIIIPTMILSTLINVVFHNYYKALNIEFSYFCISCVVLALSFIMNYLAFHIFGSMESISGASVISMAVWYIAVKLKLCKYYKYKIKDDIYLIFIILGFYLIGYLNVTAMGKFVLNLMFLIILTIIVYFKELKNMKGRIALN